MYMVNENKDAPHDPYIIHTCSDMIHTVIFSKSSVCLFYTSCVCGTHVYLRYSNVGTTYMYHYHTHEYIITSVPHLYASDTCVYYM